MALSYKFTILDRFPEIIKLINELSKLKVSSKKYKTTKFGEKSFHEIFVKTEKNSNQLIFPNSMEK